MITLVFVVLVLFAVAWPLVRYAAFAISNYRSGELALIREKTGGLGWPVLRGVLTAMAAELIAVATYPLGWFREFGRDGEGTPVVLVHGLFHNASAWSIMLNRLDRAGFHNLHTYQYDSFSKDFETAVEGMEKKLDRVLGARTGGSVILIGHSLGGLVCRRVAGDPKYRDRVAGLMALGSPHKGSDLAWFGGNAMSRGLIPGRSIAEAVAGVPDPECPKLAVYTLVDDFVFPLSMLLPDRPGWEERICSPMGHVWMVYSREVTAMVIEFLRKVGG